MNVLIIEDDMNFSNRLKEDLELRFKDLDEKINMEIENRKFNQFKLEEVDVAFVDIILSETENGIDIVKEINKTYPSAKIIFISAKEELVFKTFTTNVFHFIRKKHYQKDFEIVINQFIEYYKEYRTKRIVSAKGKKIFVHPSDVTLIIASGHDTDIYGKERYNLDISINDILKQLNSNQLVQIQRGTAMNLNYIKEIKKTKIVTKDGKMYKVGRKYQTGLIEKYEAWLLK